MLAGLFVLDPHARASRFGCLLRPARQRNGRKSVSFALLARFRSSLERKTVNSGQGQHYVWRVRFQPCQNHQPCLAAAIGTSNTQYTSDNQTITLPGLVHEMEGVLRPK